MRPLRHNRSTWIAPAWALAAVLPFVGTLAGDAAADDEHRTDEPGEAPRKDEPRAGAPTGAPISYATRPAESFPLRACSQRFPLCVHGGASAGGRVVLEVLGSVESAWATLTGALGLPAPDLDPETLTYDVYLVDPKTLDDGESATTSLEARDVRSRLDRGRAFTRIDRNVRSGCLLDALAAREIARAILWRVAPATDPATARATTTYFAQLVVPCSLAFAGDDARAFQSNAAECIVSPEPPAPRHFDAGSALFWRRLDWAFGRGPGAIPLAAWALSPTATPVPAQHWKNEPDAFDVLRVSFKNALSTGSTLNDVLLDFGVARAFFGSADDGQHAPETRVLGDDARIAPDWDIPWPSTPRRFSPRVPPSPSGASYVVVHTRDAPKGARLRAEITWEEHALFRWAFVKLDAAGRELGRVVIPTKERATEAQMTLVDLEGVDRVVLVGVNVGDPAYQFDPDDGTEQTWEPHGWLVTLAAE